MVQEVFILDSAQVPHAQELETEKEVLGDYAAVHLMHLRHEGEFHDYSDRATGIILWHQLNLTAATIARLSQTRVIVRNGVGFENVDVEAASAKGIPVCNVPDYGTEEVADHTLALVLALNRQLPQLMNDVEAGNWRWETSAATRRLRGQKFGIVGCGRIGTAVALRAKALGLDVGFYDPYVSQGHQKAIGTQRYSALDELLGAVDVVSLHAPLTEETYHLIDDAQLRMMKPGSYLINTARGPIVRQEALEQALEKKWISGAALDVLEDEPNGAKGLMRFGNCIVTPHSAFYSQESFLEMRRTSAQIVRDALLEKKLINVVNGVRASIRR